MRDMIWLLSSIALAASCGGSTISSGSGGSAGTSGSGGSAGTSGSAGSAGTSGSGGSAGTSGSGGSAGTSGSGGSAGTSGSGGSAGTSGSGGSASWYACADASQCTLFANNCCGGYCTDEPISGWTALNASHAGDYQTAKCPNPMACPDCVNTMSPDYVAVCRSGKCQAVDIRTDPLSACNVDADCRLRWGSGCCEGCGAGLWSDLVAVSNNVDFTTAVCGANLPPCCAPSPYPKDALAVCNAGHCGVSFYVGP